MQDLIPLPRIVILPLLYSCNCKCVMCNIWKNEGRVRWKPDALEQIFRNDLFTQNVEVVNVTGGEPCLHEDVVDILELIVNRFIPLDTISLQTNGLHTERVLSVVQSAIQLLREQESKGRTIHLDINISLDGPEEIHDKIRGVKGAWRSAMETARNSRILISPLKRGAVSFNFTIVRQNVAYLRDMFNYSREVGIETTYTFPQETDIFVNNHETTHTFAIHERQRQELVSILKDLSGSISGRSAISRRYFMTLINLLEVAIEKPRVPWQGTAYFSIPAVTFTPAGTPPNTGWAIYLRKTPKQYLRDGRSGRMKPN